MLIGDFYYEIPSLIPELNATSFYFVAFCLVTLILSWLFKSFLRPLIVLTSSLFFLYTFGINNLYIILGFSALGYFAPLFINLTKKKSIKKILLFLDIALIIFGLFFFKYNSSLIAPLGLSFYTLKIVSYIVDCYKESMDVEINPIYYLDYVLFFPCLIAGPINKAKPFLDEIKSEHSYVYDDIATGGFRMAFGIFEKLVFCDFLANIVEKSLNNIELIGSNVLLGVILYAFQIYLDFDSYSNIALGVAKMLGFNLDENFNSPYLATSIKNFWNRWHISLSLWLKDYIYIPLGGGEKGWKKKFINITTVFIISALWHGSTFNFLLWGLCHAFFRNFEELVSKKIKINKRLFKSLLSIIALLMNFTIVALLWMLFKYTDLNAMSLMFARLIQHAPFDYEQIGITTNEFQWLIVILFTTVLLDVIRNKINIFYRVGRFPFYIRWLLYVAMILVFLIFGVYGSSFDANDFIYRWF